MKGIIYLQSHYYWLFLLLNLTTLPINKVFPVFLFMLTAIKKLFDIDRNISRILMVVSSSV